MNRAWVVIILFLIFTNSNAENRLDSLISVYNQQQGDTALLPKTTLSIAKHLLQHDIKESRKYSLEGLAFAKKHNKTHWKFQFNNQVAISFAYEGINDSALHYFKQFILLDSTKLSAKNLGSAYNNLGIIYSNTGDYQQSLYFHLKGLKHREIARDTGEIAASMNNIGLIFYRENKYEKAKEYFNKSIKLLESNKKYYVDYIKLTINAHNNLGLIYTSTKKYSEAIKEFQYSYELGKEHHLDYSNAYTLQYMGEVLVSVKEYDLALRKFNEAKRLTIKIGDEYGKNIALNNIAEVYFQLKRYNEAIEVLKESIQFYTKIGDRKQQQSSYFQLATNYYSMEKYQLGYDNLLKSFSLKRLYFQKRK